MDEIFGVIDGRFRVSIVDSTMMWIVHRAMDKAHERVKSREGVIERLHEISKFYELAVMQLDGCIKFVQEETDSQNPESSHEEVLAGLTEIRNRLQRRLYESELAILQKDRELTDRFESESKLRQALELTEKELISSQEDLEIARTRGVESSILSHQEGEDDNGDGEICELKNSVDRQVWKIREKLEFDDYEPEESKRNQCISDVKVEEMGSDIDILKETLDIAFGKMQNAIFFSEMGPIEQQIKSSIENDIVSIFLKGFVRDSQEDLEAEARRKEKQISVTFNKYWSDIMNEVTSLCEDLEALIIGQNETQPQNGEECNILDFGSRSPKREEKNSQVDSTSAEYEKEPEDEGSHDVAKMIKNHESIIREKSAEAEELIRLRQEILQEKASFSSRRGENPSLKSRIQEVLEKLENLIMLNAKVNKILGQNGDVNEEDIPLEKWEQVFTETERQKSDVDTLAEVWAKIHKLRDKEDIGIQNQICMLRQESEDKEFQNIMMEEIYITLFKGLIEKFYNDLSRWELEIQISDSTCRDFIRNMFNQQNETMESYKIDAHIKDDIYHAVFNEAMKGYCSIYDLGLARSQDVNIVKDENLYLEGLTSDNDPSQCLGCKIRQEIYGIPSAVMLKEWQKSIGEHTTESLLREEVSWFVFGETIKSITYEANRCPDTKFFNDFLPDSQITIEEDVCLVFFREMVREWEEKIETCNLETLIREEIYYTVFIEAEREVCNRYVPIQDSDVTEKPPPRKRLGEGIDTGMESLIQKLNFLSEGIEVEKNLELSASFEIMDYNRNLKPVAMECEFDESKTTFVESEGIKCILTSLSNKLEKTMKQFNNNKLIVRELKSSLETIVSEPEKVCQISPVEENVPDRMLSLSELHNVQLNKADSKCLELLDLLHIFYDFELMANKKLGAIVLRLEEMKHTLDPLAPVMASLQEKKSLYKKAFIRKCQNLRKAENEVDLLGDQVDILLSLLEKIYLILNHHSPVLQQYFDVSEILRLIKEVAVIV